MKENKATENIIIRVSKEEKNALQKKAKSNFQTLSEYIKNTCLNFMTEQEEVDFANEIRKLYDKAKKSNNEEWQNIDNMTMDMELRKKICRYLMEHGRKFGICFSCDEKNGIRVMFAKDSK